MSRLSIDVPTVMRRRRYAETGGAPSFWFARLLSDFLARVRSGEIVWR